MKTEAAESDPVVAEIPVYLSKTLLEKLYVLQYPVRPCSHTYDESTILKAKIRPQSGHVEIEMGLTTRGPTYDKSKGEQIAFNVDGAYREMRDSEDNYFKSSVMDKLVLTSSKALSDASRYAVGVMRDDSLHLSPITTVLALRPSFSYLDQADKHSDDEEKIKKVTVRFEKPETEKSRKAKEKSYGFLLRKIHEEPWIEVDYHKFGGEHSDFERRKLYCQYEDEHIDQFSLEPAEYMKHLVPPTEEVQIIAPGLPAHLMSRAALISLPLHDRVKTVMVNAGVASFVELLAVLGMGATTESSQSVLKVLQQVAVLVQGNWVVKSDIIYLKDSKSESGVPNDLIQRGRDYLLYLFTKATSVTRGEVADVVGLPNNDLKEILRGVSRYRGARSIWEFFLPTDTAFLNKYSDVVQRQQMIWQSRSEQLAHSFKNKTNADGSKCANSNSPVKKSRSPRIKSEPVESGAQGEAHPAPAKQRRANRDTR
ncbi:DNA-directed RNA polymerase III subunit RPC5 [Chionoecetes opilio]|uniref:DNA-directed RNA polymerase III subunit RPC5 n=1 Tax=Chionoecetes opilio TaxID=41210 RepID=A0A8J4XT29_CHIOP|nr:DNA-directed RNA polymerase III subunit RPC5 [Chionoecetes opilio]